MTAFPPLRKAAPGREALRRGVAAPLTADEQLPAMEAVIKDAYAATTTGPMASKLKTIHRFLACWGLQLTPYTPEVVYALGAALKWRGYRTADLYLYLIDRPRSGKTR